MRRHWGSSRSTRPMVFPDLSVAENVFISHRDRGRIVNRGQMQRDSKAVFQRLGVELDVEQPARGLTVAEQHRRDRQGTLAQRARPDHGRADVVVVRE